MSFERRSRSALSRAGAPAGMAPRRAALLVLLGAALLVALAAVGLLVSPPSALVVFAWSAAAGALLLSGVAFSRGPSARPRA